MASAPQPRLTKVLGANGVHIITRDNLTGLLWQAGFFPKRYTANEAEQIARDFRLGGIDTWRVPGPADWATVVDHSRFNPAIDTDYFPNTPSEVFLASGVPYAPNPSYCAWVQLFSYGGSGIHHRGGRFRLRLVSGPSRQFSAFLPAEGGAP